MTENIIGAIVTDCCDANARGRQETAFRALFDSQPTFVGIDALSPVPGLEAGGNVVDQLDVLDSFSTETAYHVVLANAAWRGSETKKKHDNGVPFCYSWVGERTLLASTFGDCLALARDQGIISEVEVTDAPTVLDQAVGWGALTPQRAEKIANTQFRSLEYLTRLARWVIDGRPIKSETRSLDVLPSPDAVVWTVDNFGNGTTTLLPQHVGFEDGGAVELASGGVAVCHTRLADVPTGETALTIGSKGYRDGRWLEWVIGGGNAAEKYGFGVGSPVLPPGPNA